jgi:hypothetical protein
VPRQPPGGPARSTCDVFVEALVSFIREPLVVDVGEHPFPVLGFGRHGHLRAQQGMCHPCVTRCPTSPSVLRSAPPAASRWRFPGRTGGAWRSPIRAA